MILLYYNLFADIPKHAFDIFLFSDLFNSQIKRLTSQCLHNIILLD